MTARSLAWCALRSSGGIVSSSYRSASEESGYRARASKMPCAVGKRRIGIQGARVQNALRRLFDFGFLFVTWRRPWKVVVDDVFAVAVAHFQPPADGAHPRHVDVGRKHTEVVECGVGDDFDKITANHIRRHEPHGNVSPFFRRYFRNYHIIRLWHIFRLKMCRSVSQF